MNENDNMDWLSNIEEDMSWLDAPSSPIFAQRTPEWIAARRGKITASIAAACLGLHPYMSRAKAYRIIKGTEPDDNNVHIRRGIDGEAQALRLYESRHGIRAQLVAMVVHPELPWLSCSPDGLIGLDGLVEIKRPAKLPEAVPNHHLIQVAVQLACTGRQWADYFALDQAGHQFERRLVRDRQGEYFMLVALWQFFREFVEADVEPPRSRKLLDGVGWDLKPKQI